MCNKALHRSAPHYAGFAFSLLLASALSLPAHATEKWKINMTKSHFSAGTNTLVLERDYLSAGSSKAEPGNAANGEFLVISGDRVYLAIDESVSNGSGPIKTVDYNHWKDMKIVQIGERVRSNDVCSFRCQSGHLENRRTLTFTAIGGDPSARMSGLIALNSP